ncbi:MAG: hypothetical protein JNK29_10275 [Anaerolineales bacterium]|nr:hypothetical protein [Anaerolineales bacterium]
MRHPAPPKSKTDWLRRARAEGTPFIDGGRVTFLWRGRRAPQLVGDFMHWGREGQAPLEAQPAGSGLWTSVLDLPTDAYIEYAWLVDGRRAPDPFNPRVTANGLGEANHFFYMPDAAPTPLARRDRRVPAGALSREVLPAGWLQVRGRRTVHFYQPPTADPAPLLVVFDGQDYLRRARLPVLLDNLIAQRRMRPVALALVENGGPAARMLEYACNEATLAFLLYGLLPLAQARLNLLDPAEHPGAYGVLGASLGGLMALYCGLRAPGVFGRVLSQSGAFVVEGHPFVVWDLIRYEPHWPLRAWLDVGRYEWLRDANRRLQALLQPKVAGLDFHEYNGGHNFTAWRDDLPRGLAALFPPVVS